MTNPASATRRNNKGAPMDWGALVSGALVFLEVQLQRKLDLTRILVGKTRSATLTEVRA
jgi:hypothetical protein